MFQAQSVVETFWQGCVRGICFRAATYVARAWVGALKQQ